MTIAAQDLGETVVLDILNHRGDPRKRTTLEFQVQWSDQDVSWLGILGHCQETRVT